MLFESDETQKLVDTVRRGARAWTKTELRTVLDSARNRKPPRLDSVSVGAQQRYRGQQTSIVSQALRRRFPNTQAMPVAPINWMRLVARLDAGVYVSPPERFLERADGTRVPSDDAASRLFAAALKSSRFHAVMAEAERRILIPPGHAFGQVVWLQPPGDPVGFPRIDLYWPHDVEVLCHWQAPTNFAYAYIVALRQASPDPTKKGDWWRVWSRVPPDSVDGQWGSWHSSLISTEGEQMAEGGAEQYEGGRLPVFSLHLNEPEGTPFVCEDEDLIAVVDDLNERRSNESYVIGLQGHDQMWTDDVKDGGVQKVGPDTMIQVLPGHNVGLLSPSPKLDDMRESRKLALRELAISRGNSPDAYATEPGPPLSGVAKRISNLTHDVRVAEQAQLMQMLEEEGPLPILLDVVRTYHPEGALLAGLTAHMTPRRQATIEDPAQKQQRLESARRLGWISDARGAYEAELYGSLEEAEKAIAQLSADSAQSSEANPSTDTQPSEPNAAEAPLPADSAE